MDQNLISTNTSNPNQVFLNSDSAFAKQKFENLPEDPEIEDLLSEKENIDRFIPCRNTSFDNEIHQFQMMDQSREDSAENVKNYKNVLVSQLYDRGVGVNYNLGKSIDEISEN